MFLLKQLHSRLRTSTGRCFLCCILYILTHLILSIALTRQVLLLYINVTDEESEAQTSKWWSLAEKPMLLTALLCHFYILIIRDISSEGMGGRRRNHPHWPYSQLGKDWALWDRLAKNRQVLDIPKRLLLDSLWILGLTETVQWERHLQESSYKNQKWFVICLGNFSSANLSLVHSSLIFSK